MSHRVAKFRSESAKNTFSFAPATFLQHFDDQPARAFLREICAIRHPLCMSGISRIEIQEALPTPTRTSGRDWRGGQNKKFGNAPNKKNGAGDEVFRCHFLLSIMISVLEPPIMKRRFFVVPFLGQRTSFSAEGANDTLTTSISSISRQYSALFVIKLTDDVLFTLPSCHLFSQGGPDLPLDAITNLAPLGESDGLFNGDSGDNGGNDASPSGRMSGVTQKADNFGELIDTAS